MFVGVTDSDWFTYLSQLQPDEVNFWKPGGKQSFKAIETNGLFLFKLHSPRNFIVGGGCYYSGAGLLLRSAPNPWDVTAERTETLGCRAVHSVVQQPLNLVLFYRSLQ